MLSQLDLLPTTIHGSKNSDKRHALDVDKTPVDRW